MKSIIDANLEAGNTEDVNIAVRDIDNLGISALLLICDASRWPSDKKRCDQYLAGVKLLLLYDATPNPSHIKSCSLRPLYRGCLKPASITHKDEPKLHTICLQRDVVRELIEHGANAGSAEFISEIFPHVVDDYFAPLTFLTTAEYYMLNLLNNTELARPLEPEHLGITTDSSQVEDSHAGLLREARRAAIACLDWEDETTQIFQALSETFQLLVEKLTRTLVSVSCDRDRRTLLHRAATIPGIFGLFATTILLENRANINKEDEFGRNSLDWAIEQDQNQAAVLVMQRWQEIELQENAKFKRYFTRLRRP